MLDPGARSTAPDLSAPPQRMRTKHLASNCDDAPGRRTSRARGITVALLGPFGYGNLGDAAIQDAAIAQLQSRRPDIKLVGVSLRPLDTVARHGLETFAYDTRAHKALCDSSSAGKAECAGNARRPRSYGKLTSSPRLSRYAWFFDELRHAVYIFSVLRDIDVLLMSGGGQLDDFWGGPAEHPLSLFKWSILARLQGTRVAYLSVGVGSVARKSSRWLLRLALSAATYRSYRDEGSKHLVRNAIGLKSDDPVVPDLAFALPLETVGKPRARCDSGGERLTIAIGPIPYCDPRTWPEKDSARYLKYVSLMGETCAHLLHEGHRLKFIVGEEGHDPPVIRDVIDFVSRSSAALLTEATCQVPRIASVNDLVSAISDSHLVISSRFHGVLLSLLLEKPVLALSYERKVSQLMADLHLDRFAIEIETCDLESVRLLMGNLIAQRTTVATGLAATIPPLRQSVLEQFDFVAEQLIPAAQRRAH